ncbi:MAG TPA: calcium-binding protein [Rubrobacter sp.]|nr:calcium-binding protein [Rubrobacter sp.]
MRTIKTMAAAFVLMLAFYVSLTAGTASAKTLDGTSYGDALYGTAYGDTIYGYGGSDLAYGYAGTDLLYGGNEIGSGDKLLGGAASDQVLGQKGDDALYGQNGGDEVTGGYGHDLVVGGDSEDILDGGPGSDEINARDGQKDTVIIRPGEYDTVYYDQGLDVLQEQTVSQEGTDRSSELIASGTGKTELVAKRPPEGLFGHTGEVLVEHGGEGLLVAEGELEDHLGHGDGIIDPTGRAAAGQGRS